MSPLERESYESGVDFLRRPANRSPRFKVVERDGEIVIVDGRLDDGEVPLRVEPGLQAERVAEYFNHIGYYLLIDLVGLLEGVSGTKAEGKAVKLLVHMHLPPEGVEPTKQP